MTPGNRSGGSTIGALKVSTHTDGPPHPTPYSIMSGPPVNNNVGITATASWNDLITLTAPAGVTSGHFTGKLIIVGEIGLTEQSSNLGAMFTITTAQVTLDNAKQPGLLVDWSKSLTSTDLATSHNGTINSGPLVQTLAFDVAFDTLDPLQLSNTVSCKTQTLIYYSGQSSSSDCSLGHSVYWGGITAAYDQYGQAFNGLTATGSNGFNFLSASPLAPLGAVPEPASWALLLSGFALTGGALRRRTRSCGHIGALAV